MCIVKFSSLIETKWRFYPRLAVFTQQSLHNPFLIQDHYCQQFNYSGLLITSLPSVCGNACMCVHASISVSLCAYMCTCLWVCVRTHAFLHMCYLDTNKPANNCPRFVHIQWLASPLHTNSAVCWLMLCRQPQQLPRRRSCAHLILRRGLYHDNVFTWQAHRKQGLYTCVCIQRCSIHYSGLWNRYRKIYP